MKKVFDCPPTNLVVNVYDSPNDAYQDSIDAGAPRSEYIERGDFNSHYSVYCQDTFQAFVGLCLAEEDPVVLARAALNVAVQMVSEHGCAAHAEEQEAIAGVMEWVMTCMIHAGAEFVEMGSGRLDS